VSARPQRIAAVLPRAVSDHIANIAARALLEELETWPKPGLVSHVDCGSHNDMNAGHFERSVVAITPFFALLAQAGSVSADMPSLRSIGLDAERAMLAATDGVNTHRGAIFGLGLLCAAAGFAWFNEPLPHNGWRAAHLCDVVRQRWGSAILEGSGSRDTHGGAVQARFGAGGATLQAAQGFPSALKMGLPAFRQSRDAFPLDKNAARVQAFFSLLASLEDTNLLYRGGAEGLSFSQDAATSFLSTGGITRSDWCAHAERVHHTFIARRLSPGGCADLLAITLFLHALERDQ